MKEYDILSGKNILLHIFRGSGPPQPPGSTPLVSMTDLIHNTTDIYNFHNEIYRYVGPMHNLYCFLGSTPER